MTTAPDDDWPRRVAILGVGLLGGSVALAIGRNRPQTNLVGFARHQEKRQQLTASGIVHEAVDTIAEACRDCDVIVVATPVNLIAPMVVEAAASSPEHCLITDVGSTKQGIVAAVAADSDGVRKFVAAHPIAGSEKTGAQHALESLFDDKLVIVTPADQTEAALVRKAEEFWKLTGGNVVTMSPAEHDTHLATVSHVPHLVSAMIAKMVSGTARPLVGSGWRDVTRVAAGDPQMWTAICQENRDAIGQELERFAGELERLRQLIADSDHAAVQAWLAEAKRIKEATM